MVQKGPDPCNCLHFLDLGWVKVRGRVKVGVRVRVRIRVRV